jgi:hypothetical protein
MLKKQSRKFSSSGVGQGGQQLFTIKRKAGCYEMKIYNFTLKIEAASSSETLISISNATLR